MYDSGDVNMLDYLEKYITSDLMDLYVDVCNYNEIYANGWNIDDLFKMGKNDEYWLDRANNFIKKYNIKKSDYQTDFSDVYFNLRNRLLDKLGLEDYIDCDLTIDMIPRNGFLDSDYYTKISEIEPNNSYTIAEIFDYGRSVELRYSMDEGAEIIYGYKCTHDYWEIEVENADWFNLNMTDDEVYEKVYEIFEKKFGIEEENLNNDLQNKMTKNNDVKEEDIEV